MEDKRRLRRLRDAAVTVILDTVRPVTQHQNDVVDTRDVVGSQHARRVVLERGRLFRFDAELYFASLLCGTVLGAVLCRSRTS